MKSPVSLVAIVFSALVVCAQAAPKPSLSVRLTSDRTSYRLADRIELDLARKNTGASSVVIYRRWEWGISKIRVFDSKGSEVRDVLYPYDDPPPLKGSDFILLQPGQLIETRIERGLNELVKSPGEYELVVEYVPYLSDSLARKYIKRVDVPFWSEQWGTVMSNRIRIRITR